ncbi:MAG: hypothetical protein QOI44_457, partial [Actinomycetota bacterium]|nr:hypothetical protein [Actinomycetota bacterium]
MSAARSARAIRVRPRERLVTRLARGPLLIAVIVLVVVATVTAVSML